MDNQLYGIVAGKTKSKLVNRTSDVNFTKNLKKKKQKVQEKHLHLGHQSKFKTKKIL